MPKKSETGPTRSEGSDRMRALDAVVEHLAVLIVRRLRNASNQPKDPPNFPDAESRTNGAKSSRS